MFHAGQTVLYGANGVCQIAEISTKTIGSNVMEYYVLKPVSSDSTLYVPTGNEMLVSRIRDICTAEEARAILSEESEPMKWISNNQERSEYFRQVIGEENCRDLVRLVRLLHSHGKLLSERGRRLHLSDERILREAERMVGDEIATALGITHAEALQLILNSASI